MFGLVDEEFNVHVLTQLTRAEPKLNTNGTYKILKDHIMTAVSDDLCAEWVLLTRLSGI